MTGGPLNLLELRSAWGAGGGPEKTILLSAARHDPARVRVKVSYLRSPSDKLFDQGIAARARELGVPLLEVHDALQFDPRCVANLRRMAAWSDVIHAHDYKTDVYGLLLGRGGGHARLVATAHGWTGESTKVRLYQKIDLLALRFYDKVIAVSAATRDVLLAGGVAEDRVVVVHNGIDEQLWRPDNPAGDIRSELGIGPDVPVVGSVARLSKEKGVDLLLTAAARVLKEIEETGQKRPVFVVVGDGPEKEDLAWQAKIKGVAKDVRFLGHRSDVIKVVNTFDVAVMPSRVENLPNALLEYMALGKPSVAFNVGGVPEVLGQAGRGVFPLDTDAFAREVLDLLRNPEERRRLGAEARARIEREFSFAARLDRVESIYEEVVAGPPATARPPERSWSWSRVRRLASH